MNKLEIQRCSHKLVGSKGYKTLCYIKLVICVNHPGSGNLGQLFRPREASSAWHSQANGSHIRSWTPPVTTEVSARHSFKRQLHTIHVVAGVGDMLLLLTSQTIAVSDPHPHALPEDVMSPTLSSPKFVWWNLFRLNILIFRACATG